MRERKCAVEITVNPADAREALVSQLLEYLRQGAAEGRPVGEVAADWVDTAETAGLTAEYASQIRRAALDQIAVE